MQQHHSKRAKRRATLNAHNTRVARRNRATVSAVRAAPSRAKRHATVARGNRATVSAVRGAALRKVARY